MLFFFSSRILNVRDKWFLYLALERRKVVTPKLIFHSSLTLRTVSALVFSSRNLFLPNPTQTDNKSAQIQRENKADKHPCSKHAATRIDPIQFIAPTSPPVMGVDSS
jgi:hypothetical protein